MANENRDIDFIVEFTEKKFDNFMELAFAFEKLFVKNEKNYLLMIGACFNDLAAVFSSLRRVTKNGCLRCFVIGDSAPYGIHVPVERRLRDIAIEEEETSSVLERGEIMD